MTGMPSVRMGSDFSSSDLEDSSEIEADTDSSNYNSEYIDLKGGRFGHMEGMKENKYQIDVSSVGTTTN